MTPLPLFIGAEIYRNSTYGSWHPLSIPRVSTVMDLSRALGWLPRMQYRTSPRAKPEALTLWHDAAYLEALQAAETVGDVSAECRGHFVGMYNANAKLPMVTNKEIYNTFSVSLTPTSHALGDMANLDLKTSSAVF